MSKDQEELLSNEQEQLLEEKRKLQVELANLQESMRQEVDIEPDEADPAFFEREKAAALASVLERRVQDIDRALRSMENGSYGQCERCGQQIEPGRLEVKPDATLCLSCQKEVEAANRRGRNRSTNRW